MQCQLVLARRQAEQQCAELYRVREITRASAVERDPSAMLKQGSSWINKKPGLLDHFVGSQQERLRDSKTKGLCCG
jgi:hypothetical protein